MTETISLILAAGKGKRLKSRIEKPAFKILGKSMIEWIFTNLMDAGITHCGVVVNGTANTIHNILGDNVTYIAQNQPLGTGHAIIQAEEYLRKFQNGNVIIVCGDIPTVRTEDLKKLIMFHEKEKNAVSMLTSTYPHPDGYGRIMRDRDGKFSRIVQDADASDDEKKITEIDAGVYCYRIRELLQHMHKLDMENNQSEYYQTDIIEIMRNMSLPIGCLTVEKPQHILCVNDRKQLVDVIDILRYRIITKLQLSGVTILDPRTTYIDDTVVIGLDTVIYPNVIIEGATVIGEGCSIGPNCNISDMTIGDNTKVNYAGISNI